MLATILKDVVDQAEETVGKSDGMGYTVVDITPGRGFSYRETAIKQFPNHRSIRRETYFPGPLDGMAGYSTEIKARFHIYVGWEPYFDGCEELFPEPPISLPSGAAEFVDPDICDDRIWFVVFDDEEKAEEYVKSLPELPEYVEPFQRATN